MLKQIQIRPVYDDEWVLKTCDGRTHKAPLLDVCCGATIGIKFDAKRLHKCISDCADFNLQHHSLFGAGGTEPLGVFNAARTVHRVPTGEGCKEALRDLILREVARTGFQQLLFTASAEPILSQIKPPELEGVRLISMGESKSAPVAASMVLLSFERSFVIGASPKLSWVYDAGEILVTTRMNTILPMVARPVGFTILGPTHEGGRA